MEEVGVFALHFLIYYLLLNETCINWAFSFITEQISWSNDLLGEEVKKYSSMAPVDEQMVVPAGPGPQGGGSIPLSTLIEYATQRTYHELSVLSEL